MRDKEVKSVPTNEVSPEMLKVSAGYGTQNFSSVLVLDLTSTMAYCQTEAWTLGDLGFVVGTPPVL